MALHQRKRETKLPRLSSKTALMLTPSRTGIESSEVEIWSSVITRTREDHLPQKFGVVHWELIPRDTGLNAELYRTILDRVQLALNGFTAQGKRHGQVIFQQDNAPPHRANLTRAHITETLGWEILLHPPYSPDLAPSDFHLFRSMKNHLRDVRFQNDGQVENWVGNFLEAKSATNFYQRGIQKLPRKWREVIDNNGHYIVS